MFAGWRLQVAGGRELSKWQVDNIQTYWRYFEEHVHMHHE